MDIRDTQIFDLINQETKRQKNTINLIASENYVSPEVQQATGSSLTNKYAEGYPGKRYYGGCSLVDEIELIAQERCKKLFGAEHANVQPHSGSQANQAVYLSVLQPGDLIMGMSLREGGHLTHGHPVNSSGKIYRSIQYTLNSQTEQLDYDQIEQLAREHKPKLIIAGASAYSRIIDFERFARIARSVDAYFMADIAHIAGLVAAGLHPSPIPYADFVTSTTHKTLRGPRGGLVMCKKEFAAKIDAAFMPGMQGGPFMHTIAAKAIAFHEALQDEFKQYQKLVIDNAQALARAMSNRAYRIVAGGTDNHLFIVDLTDRSIDGRTAQNALESVNISVSSSCIPFDQKPPRITSGIRLGTPAISTRGMTVADMELIAEFIDQTLTNIHDTEKLMRIKEAVARFCAPFDMSTVEKRNEKELTNHLQAL